MSTTPIANDPAAIAAQVPDISDPLAAMPLLDESPPQDPTTMAAPPPPTPPPTPAAQPKPAAAPEPAKAPDAPKLSLNVKPDPEPEPDPTDLPISKLTAEHWKKVREKQQQYEALLKDRDSKLAELQKTAENFKDFEAIRKERDELSAKIKEYTVVGDPNLTKDIDENAERLFRAAKNYLPEEKAKQLEAIAKVPPGQYRLQAIEAFAEGLNASQMSAANTFLMQFDVLSEQRNERINNARANADSILKQRAADQERQKHERIQKLDKAFDNVVREFQGKDGWKDVLDGDFGKKLTQEARLIYNGEVMDEHELARQAIMARSAVPLMEFALTAAKEKAALEAELSKIRATTPKPSTTEASHSKGGELGDPLAGIPWMS